MKSVDTKAVQPMAHPLNLTQKLRKDEVSEKIQRSELQKDNKFVDKGFYKVPKIID